MKFHVEAEVSADVWNVVFRTEYLDSALDSCTFHAWRLRALTRIIDNHTGEIIHVQQ